MDHQITEEQRNSMNLLACKIQAAGDIMFTWGPNDFANAGPEVFHDLGLGIGEAARELRGMLEEVERATIGAAKEAKGS